MATALVEVNQRPVWRCDNCGLVQFQTADNNCRRCHISLEPEPEPVMVAAAIPEPLGLAATVKSIRVRRGWSQRQLAARLGSPRTYVSKVENHTACPTLGTLSRLAVALEVSVAELLDGVERKRNGEIRELVTEPLVRQILPFLPQLTELQRDGIVVAVRDLATRQRRIA